MGDWDEGFRKAVQALISEVEGKPGVNIGDYDGGVYVCRRIHSLHIDEDSLSGQCEWVDPEDARPDELTDGISISCDCLRLGPGWWLDAYFNWYFVYDPKLARRSLAGDHSWVKPFLRTERPGAPAFSPEPGLSHRLLPKEGRPYLNTEDVVKRLRGEFAFFVAQPHGSPGNFGKMLAFLKEHKAPPAVLDAAVAGRDWTFSVIASDERAEDSTNYISFDVRAGEDIRIVYRDEEHKAAMGSLVQRCAQLLDYDVQLQ